MQFICFSFFIKVLLCFRNTNTSSQLFFTFIVKFLPFRPASWLVRDCFALKWLNPGVREITFPFLVTFNLFENDLFVFILFIVNLLNYFAFSIVVVSPFGPLL